MKQVDGRSLDEVVKAGRDGDAEVLAEYPRQRLLEAFVRVCLTVEYIHERGVLHRDLKPSNVMLGKFGEVYLLDWGLAKLLSADPTVDESDEAPSGGDTSAPTITSEEGQTAAGELMGTPG